MEKTGSIEIFNYHLIREKTLTTELAKSEIAKQQNQVREDIHRHVVAVGATKDMNLIFATEKRFLENDLAEYANSSAMKTSLGAALKELHAAEACIPLTNNPELYRAVDKGHGHPKSRVGNLPKDAVRQFLSSHKTRLLNMDKSRLTQMEKRIVDVRRNNLRVAEKTYIAMQRHALGLPPKKTKERGQGLSR